MYLYVHIYTRFEAVQNWAWFSFCSLNSTILLSCCEKVKHDFLIYFQTLSHFSLQNINFVCRCFRFFFCSSAPFSLHRRLLLFALSFVLCLLHCSRRCWFVQFDNHCGLLAIDPHCLPLPLPRIAENFFLFPLLQMRFRSVAVINC